jgi:hypothetical protein
MYSVKIAVPPGGGGIVELIRTKTKREKEKLGTMYYSGHGILATTDI